MKRAFVGLGLALVMFGSASAPALGACFDAKSTCIVSGSSGVLTVQTPRIGPEVIVSGQTTGIWGNGNIGIPSESPNISAVVNWEEQ